METWLAFSFSSVQEKHHCHPERGRAPARFRGPRHARNRGRRRARFWLVGVIGRAGAERGKPESKDLGVLAPETPP
jgi:hypothetical protein